MYNDEQNLYHYTYRKDGSEPGQRYDAHSNSGSESQPHPSVDEQLHQYESAHQSYREAVRREPDNIDYRRGALDAAVAMKKAKTVQGRIKELFRKR